MKASVIIPVYNAENTLRKCVESLVFGQEKDIEVILVDDCSQDRSWLLCETLAKEYKAVKCLRNSENRGVSYTRNQGLKAAVGKYLLFVDSDDWVSGKYIYSLVKLAEATPNKLVICGFKYINRENNTDKTFLFDAKQSREPIVELDILILMKEMLLKQLWNKIFLSEIVKSNELFFDETQSMGEDFQFVLDYIKVSKNKDVLMCNETLYYYIRDKKNSLMSHFGWTPYQMSLERLQQFCEMCNNLGLDATDYYATEKENLQNSIIYSIVKSTGHTKKEKIEQIGKISEANAHKTFSLYGKLLLKESIKEIYSKLSAIPNRLDGRIKRWHRNRYIKRIHKQIQLNDITVLSQNCIGGVLYHDAGVRFASPTINLFFLEPDFVKFVQNPMAYLEQELIMEWGTEYPIGKLGDIEIHFMHYSTCKEAKEAWGNRKSRINYNRILVLATDRNGFSETVYEEWKKIKYPKVLFTVRKEFLHEPDVVYFPEYSSLGCVPDLIPRREFYKDGVLVSVIKKIEERVYNEAGKQE